VKSNSPGHRETGRGLPGGILTWAVPIPPKLSKQAGEGGGHWYMPMSIYPQSDPLPVSLWGQELELECVVEDVWTERGIGFYILDAVEGIYD
jgi:hypothetical protein